MKSPGPEVDALLKEALAADLPGAVERRLERRLDSFLESKRQTRETFFPVRRLALGLLSIVMVAAGMLLHAAGRRSVFADSLLRVNASASLARAVGTASSMSCSVTPAELVSPMVLADRIYRDWVLLRQEPSPDGQALILLFRSRDGQSLYRMRADQKSLLPELILKTGASGFSATCVWDAAVTPL
jgi:hypothetical protein